jgi:hypothetical protein
MAAHSRGPRVPLTAQLTAHPTAQKFEERALKIIKSFITAQGGRAPEAHLKKHIAATGAPKLCEVPRPTGAR